MDLGKHKFSVLLACRKRQLHWVVLPMKPKKNEAICHYRLGTIKIPP